MCIFFSGGCYRGNTLGEAFEDTGGLEQDTQMIYYHKRKPIFSRDIMLFPEKYSITAKSQISDNKDQIDSAAFHNDEMIPAGII